LHEFQVFGFRKTENHIDRVDLRNGSEQCLLRLDQAPFDFSARLVMPEIGASTRV
jgi:hypothetical protein